MTLTLHLGVVDVPYANPPRTPRARRTGPRITTGDVAEIIEDHYGLMQFFYEENQSAIAKLLEESLGGSLESIMMGAPSSGDPFVGGTAKIDEMFRSFLSSRAADGRLKGVPTEAALHGVSHRFKHPYARRSSRPSFIDTGLLQSSFKSWVDEG